MAGVGLGRSGCGVITICSCRQGRSCELAISCGRQSSSSLLHPRLLLHLLSMAGKAWLQSQTPFTYWQVGGSPDRGLSWGLGRRHEGAQGLTTQQQQQQQRHAQQDGSGGNGGRAATGGQPAAAAHTCSGPQHQLSLRASPHGTTTSNITQHCWQMYTLSGVGEVYAWLAQLAGMQQHSPSIRSAWCLGARHFVRESDLPLSCCWGSARAVLSAGFWLQATLVL